VKLVGSPKPNVMFIGAMCCSYRAKTHFGPQSKCNTGSVYGVCYIQSSLLRRCLMDGTGQAGSIMLVRCVLHTIFIAQTLSIGWDGSSWVNYVNLHSMDNTKRPRHLHQKIINNNK